MVTQAGGPALELAVGTGRIAIPLARLGHEIWGLDTSEPMLERAATKIRQLPAAVRGRLHLHAQSMSEFDLPTQFGLIYAPFNSFLLQDPASAAPACLACIEDHLRPGGRLVIDAFSPGPEDLLPDAEELTYLERHPETGARVTRRREYTYDSTLSAAISHLTYRLLYDNSHTDFFEFSYQLYLSSVSAITSLLNTAGFSVLETFGDYLGHEYRRPEDNLILICESSGSPTDQESVESSVNDRSSRRPAP
jgi:SAM-dependent methyltransferase